MSHMGGDVGDNAPPIQAWNRTPGKPNLTSSSGNLPKNTPWCGKKKMNSNAPRSDAATSADVWSLLPDSSLPHKNESSQWPTPAELAGAPRGDGISDFSIPNSWNAPGTSLALRTLSEAEDPNEAWPPLDTEQTSNPIESVSLSRAITGSGPLVSGDNAFSTRQRVDKMIAEKPRNESFSSWGSSADGDFSAFASQQLSSTSDNQIVTNCQQPGDIICSNVSGSGALSEGQNDAVTIINTLINSKECWGQHPVDQTTPWDMSLLTQEITSTSSNQASTGVLGSAVSLAMKQRRVRFSSDLAGVGPPVESNVWSSEPPTGTGIWETHYEGRWKQPPSSSTVGTAGVIGGGSRMDLVASPPGSHRVIPSFMNTPVQQQPQGRGCSGGFQNNFFPSQSQQRFGQSAPQPLSGSGRGVLGPNGMLNVAPVPGSAFKQTSAVVQGSAGWQLPLTPDSQSPLDDTKRFLAPSGPWVSEGRVLGKQQQVSLVDTTRWPSPLGPPPAPLDSIPTSSVSVPPISYQGGLDPRKFVAWSQQAAVTPQPPPAAAPQRFHLRQNTSGLASVASSTASASVSSTSAQPLRLLALNANNQHHTHSHYASSANAALRTDIARQLILLGFHDDANLLLSDTTIEDFEKFLHDLRERTGGVHSGLNHLINSVSAVLMAMGSGGGLVDFPQQQLGPTPSQGPQAFDLFGGSTTAFHMSKQHFGGRQNPASPSEALDQLLMRESHLQATIIQLDKKKREWSMKHSRLRKMNMGGPTAHHSNSMLQEIMMQQAQISQQIEAQETQLAQVRLQINFLTRSGTGGGSGGGGGGIGNDDVATAAAATTAAAMLMRLRSAGGGGAPPNRMMNHPIGGFGNSGNGIPRGNGMLLSSSSPTAELTPRLTDLKVSMDMSRRMPWEGGIGGGVWDVSSPQQFGHASPSNTFLNSDLTTNVFPLTSPSALGDRRWTTSNSSSDLHQPPVPSSSTTNAAAAVTNVNWNGSWLLLSDLTPQFSLEVLRISITTALDQQQNGVTIDGARNISSAGITSSSNPTYEVHPNLSARYVLVGFLNRGDASLVSAFLSASNSTIKLANTVTIISPVEAAAKLQEIKSLDDELQQQQQQQ